MVHIVGHSGEGSRLFVEQLVVVHEEHGQPPAHLVVAIAVEGVGLEEGYGLVVKEMLEHKEEGVTRRVAGRLAVLHQFLARAACLLGLRLRASRSDLPQGQGVGEVGERLLEHVAAAVFQQFVEQLVGRSSIALVQLLDGQQLVVVFRSRRHLPQHLLQPSCAQELHVVEIGVAHPVAQLLVYEPVVPEHGGELLLVHGGLHLPPGAHVVHVVEQREHLLVYLLRELHQPGLARQVVEQLHDHQLRGGHQCRPVDGQQGLYERLALLEMAEGADQMAYGLVRIDGLHGTGCQQSWQLVMADGGHHLGPPRRVDVHTARRIVASGHVAHQHALLYPVGHLALQGRYAQEKPAEERPHQIKVIFS